jgi:trehalose 6-phosphate phosphatase
MFPHPAQHLGGAWAFFLDVDGTLLDIAEAPDRVVVSDHVLTLLADLSVASGHALALVSGRSITDLDRLFSPIVLPVAGLHGAERRDAAGQLHRSTVNGRLETARAALAAFSGAHPGTLLEDKGVALALHFRGAPQAEHGARAARAGLLPALAPDFVLQEGKCVLEIKPAGASKSRAIAEFMAEAPFAGRQPVFIGDDITDEDGFRAVNSLGGLSILVGERNGSAATHRLASVEDVLRWLSTWTCGLTGEPV